MGGRQVLLSTLTNSFFLFFSHSALCAAASTHNMRLPLLVSVGVLLVALLPCLPCRAVLRPKSARGQAPRLPNRLNFFQPRPQLRKPQQPGQPRQPQQPGQPQQRRTPPVLRFGEKYFRRLGDLPESSTTPFSPASSLPADSRGGHLSPGRMTANFARQLLQKLLQSQSVLLDSPEGPSELGDDSALHSYPEAPKKVRRSEEAPISLDLTFHLLREVLEMARAEKLAQQAHSNRKLMELIGK